MADEYQVGQLRRFSNGNVGRWDGQGWEHIDAPQGPKPGPPNEGSTVASAGAPLVGGLIGGAVGGVPGMALGTTAGKAYGDLYNMLVEGTPPPTPWEEAKSLGETAAGTAAAGYLAPPILKALPGGPGVKTAALGAAGGYGAGSAMGHPVAGGLLGGALGLYSMVAPALKGVGSAIEWARTPKVGPVAAANAAMEAEGADRAAALAQNPKVKLGEPQNGPYIPFKDDLAAVKEWLGNLMGRGGAEEATTPGIPPKPAGWTPKSTPAPGTYNATASTPIRPEALDTTTMFGRPRNPRAPLTIDEAQDLGSRLGVWGNRDVTAATMRPRGVVNLPSGDTATIMQEPVQVSTNPVAAMTRASGIDTSSLTPEQAARYATAVKAAEEAGVGAPDPEQFLRRIVGMAAGPQEGPRGLPFGDNTVGAAQAKTPLSDRLYAELSDLLKGGTAEVPPGRGSVASRLGMQHDNPAIQAKWDQIQDPQALREIGILDKYYQEAKGAGDSTATNVIGKRLAELHRIGTQGKAFTPTTGGSSEPAGFPASPTITQARIKAMLDAMKRK